MIKLTAQVETSTGHRLQYYDGKCRDLHGHSYLWTVDMQTEELPDARGLIFDAAHLKSTLWNVVKKFDHGLVLEYNDPLVDVLKSRGMKIVTLNHAPSAENLSGHVAQHLQNILPQWKFSVTIRETYSFQVTSDPDRGRVVVVGEYNVD